MILISSDDVRRNDSEELMLWLLFDERGEHIVDEHFIIGDTWESFKIAAIIFKEGKGAKGAHYLGYRKSIYRVDPDFIWGRYVKEQTYRIDKRYLF